MGLARRPPEGRFDRALYAPMIIGAVLNPVNTSIIAVALVPIGIALGAPPSETAWLVSGTYLATAIGQPLVGTFVDRFGARGMFLVGAVLTLIAGLVGTFAPNIWVLVAARVILGLGTCAGYPTAMRLIKYEAARTGQETPSVVLSVLTITTQVVAVVGPTLGGVLIGAAGWRSTLAINIVLGLASFLLGWRYLPADRLTADSLREVRQDPWGILLFVGFLLLLLIWAMDPSWARLGLLVAGIVLAVGFFVWEHRRTDPFVDVRVLAGNRPLLRTFVRAFLAQTVAYGFVYGFTQWLEQGYGLSPSQAGLMLLPTFGTAILVTLLTGRYAEIRIKLIVGAVVQIAACFLVTTMGSGTPLWVLLVLAVALGVPQGMISLANQNAVYHQAEEATIGASAGLLRTFMYFGAMAISSATGFFYGSRATTAGLHELGWFMLVVAGLFLVLTLTDRSLGEVVARKPARR